MTATNVKRRSDTPANERVQTSKRQRGSDASLTPTKGKPERDVKNVIYVNSPIKYSAPTTDSPIIDQGVLGLFSHVQVESDSP